MLVAAKVGFGSLYKVPQAVLSGGGISHSPDMLKLMKFVASKVLIRLRARPQVVNSRRRDRDRCLCRRRPRERTPANSSPPAGAPLISQPLPRLFRPVTQLCEQIP